MLRYLIILVFLPAFTFFSCAQNDKPNYQGEWTGFLPNKNSFNFSISLEDLGNSSYQLLIKNDKVLVDRKVSTSSKDKIQFSIDDQLFFDLQHESGKKALTGFIKSGKFLYRVIMPWTVDKKYVTDWHPFMFDDALQSQDINLYMEYTESGNLEAYPFFGDQRFRGAWTREFEQRENILYFKDGNTGFNFQATLLDSKVELRIYLTDALIAKTILSYAKDGWDYTESPIKQIQDTHQPAQLQDGWETASIEDFDIDKVQLKNLIQDVQSKKHGNTHSILIAKKDKLVFECYFDGHNANIPHDLRSASKSISSAIVGLAINEKLLSGTKEHLYDLVPKAYAYTKDSLKSKITVKHLLTMSSGLDVNNLASEDYYQNPRNTNPWLKTVLEAPVVKEPGTYGDYGSANPFLLGIALNERLDIPLEQYMHEKLFEPLGITNYINQTDDSETIPYFGGGMLLTSRDFLKFGQLYLNKGLWQGNQIIPESWVEESFGKYIRLQDYRDKNEYGYLWWHDSYEVDGKKIETFEARGAGGQFIFIVPALDSVIVFTSGNFRNRMGNQPRVMLKDYILPALLN